MFQSTRRGVRLAMVVVCLAVVSLVVNQEGVQSASTLVSHWKLDEGSGTTTIDSEASRIGTLRNGVRWISGRSGAAVNMDGVDDYISLPSLEVTGGAFTIAAWLKNSSFPPGVSQRFIAKASDSTEQGTYWMLGQTNTSGQNRLRFRLKTGSQTTTLTASSGNLPVNTWYHVVATYDGRRMRLYLNGAQVGSIVKSGSVAQGSGVPVHIGRSPDGSGYPSGAIDDVRIYTSAITPLGVSSLIAVAGRPGSPTPTPTPTPPPSPPPPAPPAPNQPPFVSLTAPSSGAVFKAPASITISADASDANGSVTRVDFYRGSTLIGSDTTSPYSVIWPSVAIGSYSLTAVARDSAGATTVSSTRDITVRSPNLPTTAVFTPSSNHSTAVKRYVIEIFTAGADTRVANPVATRDIGQPSITSGEIKVDIVSTILALNPGNYVATVTAFGDGGSNRSAPSPQFTR